METSPITKMINRIIGKQNLIEENVRLKQKLIEQSNEFDEEKLHKSKAAGSWTVKEPEWLYLKWRCYCGLEHFGQFPREKGFNFTCTNCGQIMIGAISGFDEKAKEAFIIVQRFKLQKKAAIQAKVNAVTVTLHELIAEAADI